MKVNANRSLLLVLSLAAVISGCGDSGDSAPRGSDRSRAANRSPVVKTRDPLKPAEPKSKAAGGATHARARGRRRVAQLAGLGFSRRQVMDLVTLAVPSYTFQE